MVNTDKLKGAIVSCGYTQKDLREKIGLTARQWQLRLESQKFDSDEIERICDIIGWESLPIFFEKKV